MFDGYAFYTFDGKMRKPTASADPASGSLVDRVDVMPLRPQRQSPASPDAIVFSNVAASPTIAQRLHFFGGGKTFMRLCLNRVAINLKANSQVSLILSGLQ